jgi:hypothetical protein
MRLSDDLIGQPLDGANSWQPTAATRGKAGVKSEFWCGLRFCSSLFEEQDGKAGGQAVVNTPCVMDDAPFQNLKTTGLISANCMAHFHHKSRLKPV